MSGLTATDLAHAIALLDENLRAFEKSAEITARFDSPEMLAETQTLIDQKRERLGRFQTAFNAAIEAQAAARVTR